MDTILVVDDEPAILAMLVDVLAEEGYAVLAAPDGMAALELLAGAAPDLVLTDATMPRLDGAGLVRRLRARAGLRGVPAILMSAVAPPDLVGLGDGAVLPKPFDLEALLDAIAAALGAARG